MYSDLRKVLIDPQLKSGLIISPSGCGNTTALAHKAILSALEGKQVLVIARSLLSACYEGGFIGRVEDVLEELMIDNYRISPKSGIITIGEGKIKVADLDFVLDKEYDLIIYLDGLDHTQTKCLNPNRMMEGDTIIQLTHYQLTANLSAFSGGDSIVRDTLNMRGVVSSRKVAHWRSFKIEEGTALCSYSPDGSFCLEVVEDSDITKRDNPVLKANPVYRQCISSLNPIERVERFSTDLNECYGLHFDSLVSPYISVSGCERALEDSLVERVKMFSADLNEC